MSTQWPQSSRVRGLDVLLLRRVGTFIERGEVEQVMEFG